MTRRWRSVVPALLLVLVSCGVSAPDVEVASVATVTTSTVPRPIGTAATPTAAARVTATTAPRRINVSGSQAVVVTAARYGAGTATLTAYERTPAGWRAVLGPWSAFVGHKGIAPPGAKREGDGRTPSGTYGFDFFFGVQPDPGVRFPYRRVTGPDIVWVEDPASPHYNQWADTDEVDAGNDPDNMYDWGYDYGAVVSYNTAARTPGLGSGIFIHISRGRPSTGCITLPIDRVVALLRWLDPAASPAIVVGVGA